MRITALHATDFLSFQRLSWTDVALDLNVIVGPNGAGKTNLLQIPRVVAMACHVRRSILDDPVAAVAPFLRHHGAQGPWYEAGVGLTFDQPGERRLLVDYFVASFVAALSRQPLGRPGGATSRPSVPARIDALAGSWEGDDTVDSFQWLFSGTLFARWYPGPARNPAPVVYYEFQHEGRPLRWLLGHEHGPAFAAQIPGGVPRHWSQQDLWRSWTETLSTTDQEGLYGFLVEERPEETLPILDLAPVLRNLTSDGRLGMESPESTPQVESAALGRLNATVGIPEQLGRTVTARELFGSLLEKSLTVTANRRVDPRMAFASIDDVWLGPLDLAQGADLALQLFRWRNGAPAQQASFERARDVFGRLSGGAEVLLYADAAPPRTLMSSSRGRPDWTAPAEVTEGTAAGPGATVRIGLLVRRAGAEAVPLGFSGAGMSELLYLSTLLAEPSARVLLLDEPGANLHPSTQRQLRHELKGSRAQVVVVTHSPYLVDAEEPHKIRRVYLSEKGSQMGGGLNTRPCPNALLDARTTQLLKKTSDAAALLFAHVVILVDGEEDAAALPEWFRQWNGRDGRSLDDLNVTVFGMDGKTEAPKYIPLLSGYGVHWFLLADGDALKPGKGHPLRALRPAGVDVGAMSEEMPFGELKTQLRTRGVFVVGDSIQESLTTWIEREVEMLHEQVPEEARGSKPRTARWAAVRVRIPPPPEVEDLFGEVLKLCPLT